MKISRTLWGETQLSFIEIGTDRLWMEKLSLDLFSNSIHRDSSSEFYSYLKSFYIFYTN